MDEKYLETGTWPEAIEMPGKAITVSIKCKKTLGVRGGAKDPAGEAYSAPPDPLAEPLPRSWPFGTRLSSPPNFKTPLS